MALWIVLMQIDEKTSTHFLWSRHIKDKLLKQHKQTKNNTVQLSLSPN